mmetsp:Transcript_25650/g.59843  ORF Transcript_25650/g.59843 Transcript_25650/m.59843 type:complete len:212 (-) Transcript_25650:19-654(-)
MLSQAFVDGPRAASSAVEHTVPTTDVSMSESRGDDNQMARVGMAKRASSVKWGPFAAALRSIRSGWASSGPAERSVSGVMFESSSNGCASGIGGGGGGGEARGGKRIGGAGAIGTGVTSTGMGSGESGPGESGVRTAPQSEQPEPPESRPGEASGGGRKSTEVNANAAPTCSAVASGTHVRQWQCGTIGCSVGAHAREETIETESNALQMR